MFLNSWLCKGYEVQTYAHTKQRPRGPRGGELVKVPSPALQ